MIPKVIHYCWFGHGEMSPMMKKCLKSWKKYCPDYEIIEWNEENFDISSSEWTKEAYEAKKYAFVADYVRLEVLYKYGGVYMDTDQELIKSLDPFLKHSAFIGFMDTKSVNTGLMGAEKEHPIIKQLYQYYGNRHFLVAGKPDLNPNTEWGTQILLENGFKQNNTYQILDYNMHVYPQTYFCPTSCVSIEDCTSKNTVSLHHFAMTWRTEKAIKNFKKAKVAELKYKIRYAPNRIFRKLIGDEVVESIKKKIKR